MKVWLGLGIGLLLTACSVISSNNNLDEGVEPINDDLPETVEVKLDDLGPAPELENEVWLNVTAPLRMEDLRGSVILIDMWTFG